MDQEGINKYLIPELEEPPEQKLQFDKELLKLEAQNLIFTSCQDTLPCGLIKNNDILEKIMSIVVFYNYLREIWLLLFYY